MEKDEDKPDEAKLAQNGDCNNWLKLPAYSLREIEIIRKREWCFTEKGVDPELFFQFEPLEGALTNRDLGAFLECVRRQYHLGTLIYFCPAFRGRSLADPFVVQAPCMELEDPLNFERCAVSDPMLQASVRTVLPTHWTHRPRKTIGKDSFPFTTVDVCDRRGGISIPVRGPSNGVRAVLVAISKESAIDWEARRHELAKVLFYVAHYVHQRVSDLHVKPEQINLNAITRRETEALKWAAEGKTLADMAILMRISVETVKAHLGCRSFQTRFAQSRPRRHQGV